VLFITPEQLFMEDLAKFGRKISMVCVDENPSRSEWSHNFRPTYVNAARNGQRKIRVTRQESSV